MKTLKLILATCFFLIFFCSCKGKINNQTKRTVIINESDIRKEMKLLLSNGIQLLSIETLDSNGIHKRIKKSDSTILRVKYESFLYHDLNHNTEIRLSKFYHKNYKLIFQRDKYIVITNDSTKLVGFSVWLKNKNIKFRLEDGRYSNNFELSANVLLVKE